MSHGFKILLLSIAVQLFVAGNRVYADGVASEATKISAHFGSAVVESSGFYKGRIPISTILGVDVQVGVLEQLGLIISSEVGGAVYFNLSGGFRYFPWSNSGKFRLASPYIVSSHDYPIKPFFSAALNRGQLRLQTQDDIGATQITSQFLGGAFGGGVAGNLADRWEAVLTVEYARLMASAESAVAFTGNRFSLTGGFSYAL